MPIVPAHLALALVLALQDGAPAVDGDAPPPRFPTSTALAEGLSPAALDGLVELVHSFVDDGEVVGAELLVITNGRTILRDAHGLADVDAEEPLEPGRVFCVRSMTKPLIGTAILMLVEDKALRLGDRVAEHLPAFDADGFRDITVEHLLTHTSGLPMSMLVGENLATVDGIQAVAALGTTRPLATPPGEVFEYSDQGTDTLTALIEAVSGMPAQEFVRTRVLEPLGMEHSTCVMRPDDPLRALALPAYFGAPGNWTRFWAPSDPPLFPFFLGSQGLYTTTEDYARFCDLWLGRGRIGRERLLGTRFVRKALAPSPVAKRIPTGFDGLECDYGFLTTLWTGAPKDGDETSERELVAFGHGGSDGTHAWVFPDQDTIVLYFTQSRGTTTGLRVEQAIAALLLGAPFDPNVAAPPLEQFTGYFWEGPGDPYRAVVLDEAGLSLEVLGRAVLPLTYMGEDRWRVRDEPNLVLAFQRDEAGAVTGYEMNGNQEFRFDPVSDLPSVDAVCERVVAHHHMDLVETLGPLRITTALEFEPRGRKGTSNTTVAWPDRYRSDAVVEADGQVEFERVAHDGTSVRYMSRLEPVTVLDGPRAEFLRRDHVLAQFGDWRRSYPTLQVVQRLARDTEDFLVVRAGATTAPAVNFYVGEESGRVMGVDGLSIGPLGRMGYKLRFDDFREVEGLLLPYRMQILYPNPLMGTVVGTTTDVAFGVAADERFFRLED
jgi:CubicO group peptidase (beta-lactamase class C family)